MIIERIVFYGTMIPITLILIAFCFYMSWNTYERYQVTKDDGHWRMTDKYDWVPTFLLGLATLIGAISFVIGFEYGILKAF